MWKRAFLFSALLVPLLSACGGAFLSEGDQAPPFTLADARGGQVSPRDFLGKRPVLLYFSMAAG